MNSEQWKAFRQERINEMRGVQATSNKGSKQQQQQQAASNNKSSKQQPQQAAKKNKKETAQNTFRKKSLSGKKNPKKLPRNRRQGQM